jgi:hypothetical protein
MGNFSLTSIQGLYLQFLNNFPVNLRPIISIGLAVLLVYSIFKIIKQDFLWIIVLVILLPSSWPILQSIWAGILTFIKFLVSTK